VDISSSSPVALVLADALRTGVADPEYVRRLQRRRLATLVRHARTSSPFYRDLYRGLPARVTDPTVLPAVDKRTLMADFDDWVTDPDVTLEALRRDFLPDLSLVGTRYLGRYHVMTTSGTTGEPAVLLHDRGSWHVMHVLARTRPRPLAGAGDPRAVLHGNLRTSALYAGGGHYGGMVTFEAVRHASPFIAKRARAFSVLSPIEEIVAGLNEFQPSVIGGYPSAMMLLAGEQRAGRLRIHPVRVFCAGELLTDSMRTEIESTFGCTVGQGYAASEVPALSLECDHRRLHLNADWYLLEPVDDDRNPVPVGQPSSTVLVTNLSNRVQPVIRYDLGDRVTMDPTPCPCGSRLPAFSVEGRTNDVLTFESSAHAAVAVLPLALASVIEETPGVHRFQAIGTGPHDLTIRLDANPGARLAEVWEQVDARVHSFLASLGAEGVVITHSPEAPLPDPHGGKLRQVVRASASRPVAAT
jgi:phenylacetate-coenzyme A ligase PaaK-like adenylate-forming protein